MYHSESISAESKLKEAEKQEEKQIGRGDPVFSIRMEERYQRRSSVKKIEKMREKVQVHFCFFLQNTFLDIRLTPEVEFDNVINEPAFLRSFNLFCFGFEYWSIFSSG